MSVTANPAKAKPTVACVGTVSIVTDRDTGDFKVYQKPDKDDMSKPGNIVIHLQFTPDASTSGFGIRQYPFLHPEQLNPNNRGEDFQSWYQDNWDRYFISNAGGKVALFEYLATVKGTNLAAMEDAYNAATGTTDCRMLAKYLNDLTMNEGEPIMVGYILKQAKAKGGILLDEYRIDGFFDPSVPPKSNKIVRLFN